MTTLAPTLQAFFTDRLIAQRHCSPRTITSYRDTMRLLLQYAHTIVGRAPAEIDLADLDAELISAFLDHLERDRHNTIGTRNARLAAIRSLFSYASLRHPEHAADIARVLAIPPKRHDRTIVTHLTKPEITALLDAPDTTTWIGRRDHTMIRLALESGLRVSELTALTRADTQLGTAAHVACHGNGRKDRITPLTKPTAHALHTWLRERGGEPPDPIFPTSRGLPLTRDAIARRLTLYTHLAATNCPTLHAKKVTPHVLTPHRRHETPPCRRRHHRDRALARTRKRRDHADLPQRRLSIKERALARTNPTKTKPGRYRPTDKLLTFLEAL